MPRERNSSNALLPLCQINQASLVDNALTEEPKRGFDLDYAVEFRNFDPSFQGDNHWRRPDLNNCVQLFKPHGSLNWLFCPTCTELEITQEKGVVTRLISDFAKKECVRCGNVFSPLIVPPTFYKDLNNVFLSAIWNRTDDGFTIPIVPRLESNQLDSLNSRFLP